MVLCIQYDEPELLDSGRVGGWLGRGMLHGWMDDACGLAGSQLRPTCSIAGRNGWVAGRWIAHQGICLGILVVGLASDSRPGYTGQDILVGIYWQLVEMRCTHGLKDR